MWWESVKELIEYAKTEKPDVYKILEMANTIAEQWSQNRPPTTNDPDLVNYVQVS